MDCDGYTLEDDPRALKTTGLVADSIFQVGPGSMLVFGSVDILAELMADPPCEISLVVQYQVEKAIDWLAQYSLGLLAHILMETIHSKNIAPSFQLSPYLRCGAELHLEGCWPIVPCLRCVMRAGAERV